MADNSYLELLGQEGYKQFEDAKKSAKEIGDIVVTTNGKIVEMFNSLKGNNSFQSFNKDAAEAKKIIAELEAKIKEYEKANISSAKVETENSKQRLNNARAETEAQKKLLLEKREAQKVAKEEQKAIKELDGAYKELSRAYGVALKSYKDLAAQHNTNHPLVKQAATDAKALNDRLKEIDAGVGNYQRNVGNYSGAFNGLKVSINQLASEIPNFAQSMRIGILSVGNNISQLGQSIQFAQQKNAELIAQGQKAIPIWGQVAKSLFSWQTAIIAVIAAITAISQHGFPAWVEGLSKKQKLLNDVNSKAVDIYADEEVKLQSLSRELERNEGNITKVKKIRDEIVKDYPKLKDNLEGELNLTIRLTDAINKVSSALKLQAVIRAAQELITEETKKQLKSEIDGANLFIGIMKSAFMGAPAALASAAKVQLDESKKTIDDLFKVIEDAQNKLNNSGLGDVLGGGDKTKKEKELKFNGDLLKAKVQQEARSEQMIFEDEKLLYTARLAARARYSQDLIQIVKIEEKAALKNAKTVEERATIEQDASTKIQDIHLDEAKFVEGIIEKTTDKKKFTLIKGLDDELKAINDSNDLKLKNEEKFARESDRLAKQSAEYKKRLYMEIANTAFGIADAIIDKDMQKLDQDGINIDKKLEQERTAIEASTLSEEEKQDRIKNAELVAAQAKEEIERKRINLERTRFYVERANAAANVTITTLKDIAAIKGQAALLAANPITAALAPIALAQIPVVAGTSAAALALILGQVALYGDGTDSHKGGDAIIGERFEPEWVEKNGKGQWVSTPTYFKDLAAGTSVTPLHDMVASAGGMSMAMAQSLAQHTGDVQLLNEIKGLRTDIKNKPETTYVQENGNMTKKIKIGNRVVSYLDKNIYW